MLEAMYISEQDGDLHSTVIGIIGKRKNRSL